MRTYSAKASAMVLSLSGLREYRLRAMREAYIYNENIGYVA